MIIHYLSQITWIINSSLASGIFPCIWKKAEVLPISKGDHRMSNNNRPISLVTILSKVCERVAFNQLVTNLVANSQLATGQNGNSNGKKITLAVSSKDLGATLDPNLTFRHPYCGMSSMSSLAWICHVKHAKLSK